MSKYLIGGFQQSGFSWTVLGLQLVNGLAVNRMQSERVLDLATQASAVYSSHHALFTAWPSGTCKASYQ